jgi:hypothetical protein
MAMRFAYNPTIHFASIGISHTEDNTIKILSEFFNSPTDAQVNGLKNKILKFTLKFTLKQLLRVSVQAPSSGSALFELAKVTVVKIIN